MRQEATKTALGDIKIHKNVLISTCCIAALETEGVSRLYSNLKDEIIRVLKGSSYHPGVNIIVDKNNEIAIWVYIVAKFGYNISSVASKVQENIKLAIDKIADVNISDINVVVKGLERR